METIDGYGEENQESWETKSLFYYGADLKGNSFYVRFQRNHNKESELILLLSIDAGSTIYELPEHPSTAIRQDKDSWSFEGLKITVLEKDKRVRITFNGFLRKGTRKCVKEDSHCGIEHVRLNFIFVASSKPYLSRASGATEKLTHDKAQFDQYGSMMGLVRLKNGSEQELFIRGIRQFCVGNLISSETKTMTLIGLDEIGNIFCAYYQDKKGELEINKLGHVKDPLDHVHYIKSSNPDIEELRRQIISQHSVCFKFTAGKSYKVKLTWQTGKTKKLYRGYPWSHTSRFLNFDMELNGTKGVALVETIKPYDQSCPIELPIPPNSSMENSLIAPPIGPFRSYVLDLTDPFCKNEDTMGGRSASLAQMKSLNSPKFTVLDGFCLTIPAFKHFLSQNEELSNAISNLIESFKISFEPLRPLDYSPPTEPVKPKTCDFLFKIAYWFTKARLPIDILDDINVRLSRVEATAGSVLWTVQGSAYHDDSDETCWGGQDQVYYNVTTDNVVKCIIQCWAGLFTPDCVEYRRLHGLPLDRPIGICVQLMVEADSTGSLFSRDPRTGDPRNICVASQDRIDDPNKFDLRVCVSVSPNNEFSIETSGQVVTAGRINSELSMHVVPKVQASQLSVGDEVVLRLAKIGRELDQLYGSGLFIDWAYVAEKDEIHLQLCRPLTDMDAWTDFELSHELGSGVPGDKDLLTYIHAGELFPLCVTPLTCTTICETLAPTTYSSAIKSFDDEGDDEENEDDDDDDDRRKNPLFIANMRVSFNYFDLMLRNNKETIGRRMIVRDFARCGYSIASDKVREAARRRIGLTGTMGRLKLLGSRAQTLLKGTSQAEVDDFEDKIETYIPLPDLNEATMQEALKKQLDTLRKVSRYHGRISRLSDKYQVRILSLLAVDDEEVVDRNFSDIAQLLGHCRNVVSAQLPKILNNLVDRPGWSTHFWRDRKATDEWNNIDEYIRNYGHIGPHAFELASETYAMRPDMIYGVLEHTRPYRKGTEGLRPHYVAEEALGLPPTELVKEIKSSMVMSDSRRAIARLLPATYCSLRRREQSKVLLSKAVHNVRLLFGQKAVDLVNAGKLPDIHHIFFLTRWELQELMKDDVLCKPELIRKAHRRRTLWPKLNDKIYYPDFWYGMPKPVDSTPELLEEFRQVYSVVHGTPICAGSACRRIVVARAPEEASLLRQWDILVAPSIDVGWSQYFPMVAGIITEMGGVLSEGAVIARDFSVPCIMGVPMATKVFKTGDVVRMDGFTGKVEKMPIKKAANVDRSVMFKGLLANLTPIKKNKPMKKRPQQKMR